MNDYDISVYDRISLIIFFFFFFSFIYTRNFRPIFLSNRSADEFSFFFFLLYVLINDYYLYYEGILAPGIRRCELLIQTVVIFTRIKRDFRLLRCSLSFFSFFLFSFYSLPLFSISESRDLN